MSYAWIACEARTGRVIADLPELACEKVSSQIGAYTSTTASLPVGTRRTPLDWQRATLPGGTFLVLVDEDDNFRPVWGGIITRRTRNSSEAVTLSVATLEAYLDRRYVGDRTYVGTGQNAIVRDLVTAFVADGRNGGVPITVRVVTSGDGQARDRTYLDSSDKTVYSILSELMGVSGGPEWTVTWEWTADRTGIVPVLLVGDRIGSSPIAGLAPSATFEIPGPVTTAELIEDYSSASGANDVMATSSASADERPQSEHVVYTDPDRPTFEVRYSPSTSITDVSTLNAHASAKAAILNIGSSALALSSVTQRAPRLGRDWTAGDDVGYVVGGRDRFGRDAVPAFPEGYSGSARTVGWELTFASDSSPEIITPVLQDTEEAS